MMSLSEQGIIVIEVRSHERAYVEALIQEDIKALASDIAEAQSRKAVGDERRLRLASNEAARILRLINPEAKAAE